MERLQRNPVIAAVKELEALGPAVESACEVIFLLTGNLFNLESIVSQVQEKEKLIYLHVDLLDGFSRDSVALEYIHDKIAPDGIISTKSGLIKSAGELGMATVQRFLSWIPLSVQSAVRSAAALQPDAIEILPGIMPRIVRTLCREVQVPLIAGDSSPPKEDVIQALSAGALGVSTTNPAVWSL